ncbi:hypothetical protein HaLaN_25004 [Haematococcus lacustris]|uniref:Uncharacterized protein n=1 Tax=Haematococcus lacustris TaxID=44745 RepID=A0A699ZVU0_HAELA|nr:hypothetical protein HaLaN_25004 [Haematococcus lacustris]
MVAATHRPKPGSCLLLGKATVAVAAWLTGVCACGSALPAPSRQPGRRSRGRSLTGPRGHAGQSRARAHALVLVHVPVCRFTDAAVSAAAGGEAGGAGDTGNGAREAALDAWSEAVVATPGINAPRFLTTVGECESGTELRRLGEWTNWLMGKQHTQPACMTASPLVGGHDRLAEGSAISAMVLAEGPFAKALLGRKMCREHAETSRCSAYARHYKPSRLTSMTELRVQAHSWFQPPCPSI